MLHQNFDYLTMTYHRGLAMKRRLPWGDAMSRRSSEVCFDFLRKISLRDSQRLKSSQTSHLYRVPRPQSVGLTLSLSSQYSLADFPSPALSGLLQRMPWWHVADGSFAPFCLRNLPRPPFPQVNGRMINGFCLVD